MYFTKEDLEYIESYLKLKAHKDTDFELLSASQIDKQDAIIAIVQNNVNYKVKFDDLVTGLSPLQLYDNYQNLPEEGSDGLIYITKDSNTPYIWYDDEYHTTIPYASPTSVGGLKVNSYVSPGEWDTSSFSIFPLILGSGGYYDGRGFTLIPVAGHTDHDYGLISVQDLKKLNNTPQLNAVGKIPAQYLPSYVDSVQIYDSYNVLPEQGREDTIYITRDTNDQYRWSAEDESYILISSSMQNKIIHADYTQEDPLYEDIYQVTDSDNVYWHFGADGWEIQVLKATTIRDGLMSMEDKININKLQNINAVNSLQDSISNISIILTDVTRQTHFTIGGIYTDGTVSLLTNALAGKIAAGLIRLTLRFNVGVRLTDTPLVYQGFMYTNQQDEFVFVLSEASIIKGNPVYLTAVSISDLVEGGQLILKGWY